MKDKTGKKIKDILITCVLLPIITGAVTGALIFLFKLCCGFVVELSSDIYNFVREDPIWLPCLILGAALIGLLAAFILKWSKNCRGGGIPTSIAILRGLITFSWVKSIFLLFATALLTFLGGVPLGTEGPSVQMGTAVGKGTVRMFGKKRAALERYIMTGGACGGFAAATGAPIAGILFAFEEAHRRFSPLLFMITAMAVGASALVMRLLCDLAGISPYLFDLSLNVSLPINYIWVAVVIGVLCGFIAILFSRAYVKIGTVFSAALKKIPFAIKFLLIFAIVALLGFASNGLIGSGHELIHELMNGHGAWYMLIIYFCVRALSLIVANRVGVSGGLFVPTLTFGALIGALFSKLAISLGIFSEDYFIIPIIIAMAAFLASSSRTPITAISFAVEALGGLSLTLPIIIGVGIAYLIIESLSVPSLQDVVINQKVKSFNEGKDSVVVDTLVTVMPDCFAQGKEVRNILWPPTCTVLSVRKKRGGKAVFSIAGELEEGDVLHIHYQTHDAVVTRLAIEAIVGSQPEDESGKTHFVDQSNHVVPDL